MRTKTKSFFEDLFIIFIIGLIIYGIYNFFFSSSENELKLEELKSSVEKKIENEISVKSSSPEEKPNEKVEEEKIEETIKQTQNETAPIITPTNIEEKIENRNEKPKEIIERIETIPVLEKKSTKEEIKTKEKEVIPTTEALSTQEEDKAKIIARLSGGSILKAMQFIDDDALALRQKALSCLQDNFSIKDIWSFIDELSSFERNKINDIMSHLQMLLRDLLLMKVNKDSDIIYNQDIKDDF